MPLRAEIKHRSGSGRTGTGSGIGIGTGTRTETGTGSSIVRGTGEGKGGVGARRSPEGRRGHGGDTAGPKATPGAKPPPFLSAAVSGAKAEEEEGAAGIARAGGEPEAAEPAGLCPPRSPAPHRDRDRPGAGIAPLPGSPRGSAAWSGCGNPPSPPRRVLRVWGAQRSPPQPVPVSRVTPPGPNPGGFQPGWGGG